MIQLLAELIRQHPQPAALIIAVPFVVALNGAWKLYRLARYVAETQARRSSVEAAFARGTLSETQREEFHRRIEEEFEAGLNPSPLARALDVLKRWRQRR